MRWRQFARQHSECGATAVEYALGISFLVLVSVGAIQLLEEESGERLNEEGTAIGQPAGDSRGVLPGGIGSPLPPPSGNTAPTGSFTKTGCVGRTCTYTATATDAQGDPISYSWSFSDGNTETGQSVSHQFPNTAGTFTYTVTLTLTDDEGASDAASPSGTTSATCVRPPSPAMCS